MQESLTNAVKHAGPAHARVLLRYAPEHLEIEVRDDGRGPAHHPGDPGHGVVRMRERVALYAAGSMSAPPTVAASLCARAPSRPRHAVSITVLIADDQQLVRAGFALILKPHPDLEVVGEASDGAEAVALANQRRSDVILMDIRMPPSTGSRRPDAGHHPRARPDHLQPRRLRLRSAPRRGQRLPPERRATRAARGRHPHDRRRGLLLAPSITRRLIEGFITRPSPSARHAPDLQELTPREQEVFELIGRGRSNGEIARQLFVTEAMVKTHVAHVFRKLDLHDRAQAVVTAHETGLIQPGT